MLKSVARRTAIRLGSRLRALRLAKGWTQSYAAEIVAVEPVTLRRWELGIFSPSQRNLERLADAYGLGVDDFSWTSAQDRGVSQSNRVPLTGHVGVSDDDHAAAPNVPELDVPGFILEAHRKAFALRVSDNRMARDGVHAGDFVIVDPEVEPRIGDLCILRIEETLLGSIYTSAGRYRMCLPSRRLEDVDGSSGQRIGNVVWHLRRL